MALVIFTSAIAGWRLTRISDDDLQTSQLVVELQRLNLVLHYLDGLSFELHFAVKRGKGIFTFIGHEKRPPVNVYKLCHN